MNISYQFNNLTPSHIYNLPLCNRHTVPIYEFIDNILIYGSHEWTQVVVQDEQISKNYDPQIIRRHLPTICYNCHGMTFASRRGHINDPEIVIKNDNYLKLNTTEIVLPGDIVCYIDENDNSITHTGIICNVEANATTYDLINDTKTCKIISKWGRLGEFIHDLLKSPYSEDDFLIEFYRFIRSTY